MQMGQCASKNAAIPEQGYLNTLVHDGVLVEELRSVILPVVRHRLVGNLRLPVISNIFFYPCQFPPRPLPQDIFHLKSLSTAARNECVAGERPFYGNSTLFAHSLLFGGSEWMGGNGTGIVSEDWELLNRRMRKGMESAYPNSLSGDEM